MKVFLGIVGGVAVTFIGLVAFSMYMTQPTDEPSEMRESSMQEAFVGSCMAEGANRAYCVCAYDGIVEEHGHGIWVEMDDKSDDEVMDFVMPYAIECSNKLSTRVN